MIILQPLMQRKGVPVRQRAGLAQYRQKPKYPERGPPTAAFCPTETADLPPRQAHRARSRGARASSGIETVTRRMLFRLCVCGFDFSMPRRVLPQGQAPKTFVKEF